MQTKQTIYVVVGGTSGIGAHLAKQLESEESVVHVVSRRTGVDIGDEQAIRRYFDTVGAFDHLIVTAGSSAPSGKVVDVDIAQAKGAFDTKFWGVIHAAKPGAHHIRDGG